MTDLPNTIFHPAATDTRKSADESPRVRATPLLNLRLLDRVETGLAVFCTLVVVGLHVYFYRHAGAMWRDEVNGVNLSTLPSFKEIWSGLEFESFPVVFYGVVRAWAGVFGADNDAAFRALGLLIGLGIVGALWLNARQFGARWPLCSVVLLGGNPSFVRYGDSVRAHGLGMLLILLTLAAVWRVVNAPRAGRVLLAMALAVLSVQTFYHDAVLLFVICVAGAATAAWERRWRTAAVVLSIGAPAAASMLVYAGTIHRRHGWNDMMEFPVTLSWMWKRVGEVTGSPDPLGVWVWSALFVGALGLAGWCLARGWRRVPAAGDSGENGEWNPEAVSTARVMCFAAATLVGATICYPLFLKALNYYTQPWYYIAYLALVAVCLDAVCGRVLAAAGSPSARAAALVGVCAVATLTFVQSPPDLKARQTNLDFQAAALAKLAGPDDLIVCNRWECAIPLAHYYHGETALVTLPPLANHRFHRYDLVREQMMLPDPARPVLDRIEATLLDGHRVWLSGELMVPPNGEEPLMLPPARVVNGRWPNSGAYYLTWAMQVNYLLEKHATAAHGVPVTNGQPVMNFESLPLTGFQGWH